MGSRTWLAIGGLTTVAASIAVVCAVARAIDQSSGRPEQFTDRLVAADALAGDEIAPPVPAEADKTSERDHSGPLFGSERERSQVPPD